MALWLLTLRRPDEYCPAGVGVTRAVVVCAKNPAKARELVFNAPPDSEVVGYEGSVPWIDPTKSDCVKLEPFGTERIILVDHHEL